MLRAERSISCNSTRSLRGVVNGCCSTAAMMRAVCSGAFRFRPLRGSSSTEECCCQCRIQCPTVLRLQGILPAMTGRSCPSFHRVTMAARCTSVRGVSEEAARSNSGGGGEGVAGGGDGGGASQGQCPWRCLYFSHGQQLSLRLDPRSFHVRQPGHRNCTRVHTRTHARAHRH